MAADYLAKYGQATLDNGYDICFIRPGEKRPFGDKWGEKKHGPKALKAALLAGRGNFGIGIKTWKTPGVDIDCYDRDVVDAMVKFTTDLLGETLERVGLPPKTLLLYRAEEPFPKTQSRFYEDDQGRPVKLEVLGDGQQFVALHIHPDTEKPYRWKDKRHVANTPVSELPVITQDDALLIVQEFERLAKKKGWPIKASGQRMEARSGDFDYDDPFISDKSKVDIATEELRRKLDLVPNPQDHDQWFQVGMALYHQFDGSEEGLLMWHEWSSQASNYDQDACDYRWTTFDVEGKKREPLTARYILRKAKEEEERVATEELDQVQVDLEDASDIPAIRAVMEKCKRTAFDTMQREILAQAIQKRIAKVGSVKMSLSMVKGLIRYENPENTAVPAWLSGFVYVQHLDAFYSSKKRQALAPRVFDATFGRYMLTKKDRLEGRSTPEHSASHVALNRYEVETVANVMYMPTQPEIFSIGELHYINSFNPESMPEAPETLTKKQRKMVERFERHVEHLFPDQERDRKLLLSWMAYIVQTRQRCNWCPILQGVEGDGKTTIANALSWVLGHGNAATINGDSLKEKYSPWAENGLFLFIEEVRLHGLDRYDVINKLKPFISNTMVPIRRMQTDVYNVYNTISYMMGTNFKNAVPVNDNDSRYFPIFSQWQNKEDLEAFKLANPTYYADLAELEQHADALRYFFMNYELHPDFHPMKRAPESAARQEMIELNQTEEDDALETILKESTDGALTAEVLDTNKLRDAMDGSLPYGRALNTWLSERGFTLLGRYRLSPDDKEKTRVWSKRPNLFQVKLASGKTSVDLVKVRKHIDSFDI